VGLVLGLVGVSLSVHVFRGVSGWPGFGPLIVFAVPAAIAVGCLGVASANALKWIQGLPDGVEPMADKATAESSIGIPPPGSRCPICGGPMQEAAALVYCEHCSTPHHSACWDYTGECSTYGCGATRFRRTPDPPPLR
jgi:hypothetical protein